MYYNNKIEYIKVVRTEFRYIFGFGLNPIEIGISHSQVHVASL